MNKLEQLWTQFRELDIFMQVIIGAVALVVAFYAIPLVIKIVFGLLGFAISMLLPVAVIGGLGFAGWIAYNKYLRG
jgi:hypothetical protein